MQDARANIARRRSLVRRAASILLLGTAALKLASLGAQPAYLQTPDPVLEMPTWAVLVAAGLAEATIAALLLWSPLRDGTLGVALLWFAACSLLYRLGHSFSSSEPCPCLGLLPKVLFWSTQATNAAALTVLAVLAVCGAVLLAREHLASRSNCLVDEPRVAP